jgi:hypothetical protein
VQLYQRAGFVLERTELVYRLDLSQRLDTSLEKTS